MSFNWLSSLSDSFMPHAENRHNSLNEDQKRFWQAIQKEDIDTIGDVASRYPQAYKGWQSKDGPPLRTAQTEGCFESFVELIGLGGSVNTDYGNGWTPLLKAIAQSDRTFFDYIIESRPNLDVVGHDEKGRSFTALQLAIDKGDADIVRRLIERGANPKLAIEMKDGEMISPADYARNKHQPKVGELIDLAEQVRAIYLHRYDSQRGQQAPKPAATEPVAAAVAAAVAPVTAASVPAPTALAPKV